MNFLDILPPVQNQWRNIRSGEFLEKILWCEKVLYHFFLSTVDQFIDWLCRICSWSNGNRRHLEANLQISQNRLYNGWVSGTRDMDIGECKKESPISFFLFFSIFFSIIIIIFSLLPFSFYHYRLSPSQRKCRLTAESEELLTSSVYSFNLCRSECRFNMALKECKCVPYFYRNLGMISINNEGY